MFHYTALIYNGVSQQLVRLEGKEDAELFQCLANMYPVFVCLWFERNPLAVRSLSEEPITQEALGRE